MGCSRSIDDRFLKCRAFRSRSIVESFLMCRMLFLKGRSRRIIRCLSEPFESVCRAGFRKRFNWLTEVSSGPVGRNGVHVQHDTMGTATRLWMFMA